MRIGDLKRFPMFAGLGEEECASVVELLEPMELDAGEQLFLEGQESDGLVLVESGALKVSSNRSGSLGTLGPGASLGTIGLVAVGPREVTAIANCDTRVWLLTREAFQRLLVDDPRAGCRILEAAICDFAGASRLGLDRLAAPAS